MISQPLGDRLVEIVLDQRRHGSVVVTSDLVRFGANIVKKRNQVWRNVIPSLRLHGVDQGTGVHGIAHK